MALATKYFFEFEDDMLPVYPTNELYRIEVQEEGFAGAATELTGSSCRMRYQADTSRLKNTALITTELRMSIVLEDPAIFEFLDFDERQLRAVVIKEGVQIWQGFIKPAISDRPHYNTPYQIQLRATDGLADLKGVDYVVNGQKNLLQIINECLLNTGHTLEYSSGMNLFEASMNTALEPFSQIVIDTGVFVKNDKPMSCYDVLRQILRRFCCRIMLKDNKWDIDRFDEIENVSRTKRVLDTSLVETSQMGGMAANVVGNVDEVNFPMRWVEENQRVGNFQGMGKVITTYDYGEHIGLLLNAGLENWSTTTNADDWTESGIVEQSSDANVGEFSARITAPPSVGATVNSNILATSVVQIGVAFNLSFDYKIDNPETINGNQMRFQVQMGTDYLQDVSLNGNGQADNFGPANTIITVDDLTPGTWRNFALKILPPSIQNVTLSLYAGTNPGNLTQEFYTFYDNVDLSIDSNVDVTGDENTGTNDQGVYCFAHSEDELLIGDSSAGGLKKGSLTVGGSSTGQWTPDGSSITFRIEQHFIRAMLNEYVRPTIMLSGDIKGRIDPTQKLKDFQLQGKDFIFMGGDHDMMEGIWSSEWKELTKSDLDFPTTGRFLK